MKNKTIETKRTKHENYNINGTWIYETKEHTWTEELYQNGKVKETHFKKHNGSKYKVIYNYPKAIIVILQNKYKGVALCNPEDTWDTQKGYNIAFNRARMLKLQDELKKLCK